MSDNSREAYAREKLWQAVEVLATLPGTVQERLAQATSHLFLIRPEDISDEGLQQALGKIRAELTSQPAQGSEGTVIATLATTSNADARQIARRILDLHSELEKQHYRRTGEI